MSTNEGPQRSKQLVTRSCLVDLTPAEIQHHGEALAKTKLERDDVAAEAKNVADKFKGEIGVKTAAIDRLARLVNDKKEMRSVECYRELQPGNMVAIIRVDTGEVVERRAADLVQLSEFKAEAEAERKRKAAEKKGGGVEVVEEPQADDDESDKPAPAGKPGRKAAKKARN